MSTPDGGSRGRADGRVDRDADVTPTRPPWCVVAEVLAVVLALASVAVVLVSDDARWLRLAVVAALWSALVGATMLIRRAVARDTAGRHEVAALRRRYTRELEREVAARHEYEATVERDVRRELAQELADSRDEELASLRDELDRLRGEREVVPTRRPSHLKVVGEAPPPPHGSHAAPAPAAVARAASHLDPSPPGAPAAASARVVPAPAAPPTAPTFTPGSSRPAPRATGVPTPPSPLSFSSPEPAPPTARADALSAGSFVDQYVRSTGYGPPSVATDPPGRPGDDPEPHRPRSVADLLAAHSAHPRPPGRSADRRR